MGVWSRHARGSVLGGGRRGRMPRLREMILARDDQVSRNVGEFGSCRGSTGVSKYDGRVRLKSHLRRMRNTFKNADLVRRTELRADDQVWTILEELHPSGDSDVSRNEREQVENVLHEGLTTRSPGALGGVPTETVGPSGRERRILRVDEQVWRNLGEFGSSACWPA